MAVGRAESANFGSFRVTAVPPACSGSTPLKLAFQAPPPRFSVERGGALWHTAGSDLWEVAGLRFGADHCLVSNLGALKRPAPLPRRPWSLHGVAPFEQVATIPVGDLPHGIWPSGDGT